EAEEELLQQQLARGGEVHVLLRGRPAWWASPERDELVPEGLHRGRLRPPAVRARPQRVSKDGEDEARVDPRATAVLDANEPPEVGQEAGRPAVRGERHRLALLMELRHARRRPDGRVEVPDRHRHEIA